mmetsp:Transcript_35297/g.62361  ORF Transcript_35297/g.62361 Transcript_35297/m.62361 type:complete len:275 (+) Transcript_35297:598-1422(+)
MRSQTPSLGDENCSTHQGHQLFHGLLTVGSWHEYRFVIFIVIECNVVQGHAWTFGVVHILAKGVNQQRQLIAQGHQRPILKLKIPKERNLPTNIADVVYSKHVHSCEIYFWLFFVLFLDFHCLIVFLNLLFSFLVCFSLLPSFGLLCRLLQGLLFCSELCLLLGCGLLGGLLGEKRLALVCLILPHLQHLLPLFPILLKPLRWLQIFSLRRLLLLRNPIFQVRGTLAPGLCPLITDLAKTILLCRESKFCEAGAQIPGCKVGRGRLEEPLLLLL